MSRDLILVAVSLFAWGVGEGMFIFFQAIYLQRWGATPVTIGAILGGVGIAMTVAQIPAGILSDRVGRRPVMWASWVLGASATWVMALANNLNAFIIGMLLYGLTSFVLAPMNSYITGARGQWSVGRALTIVSAAFNLGAVIGPAIGGILGERYGLKSVYIIAACLFVVSTIVILFVRAQPVEGRSYSDGRPHLLKNQRFLGYLAVIFVTVFATMVPQQLTPNFLQYERQVPLATIGQLGSIASLGSVLFSLTLGHLNPGLAFLIGQVLVGLFAFMLWQGTNLFWFGAAYFFSGGYRLCRSMALAQARPLIRPAEMGLAYGLIETVNSLAYILAPILAGIIYSRNPVQIYPASLGLLAVSLLVSGQFVYKYWRHPSTVLVDGG